MPRELWLHSDPLPAPHLCMCLIVSSLHPFAHFLCVRSCVVPSATSQPQIQVSINFSYNLCVTLQIPRKAKNPNSKKICHYYIAGRWGVWGSRRAGRWGLWGAKEGGPVCLKGLWRLVWGPLCGHRAMALIFTHALRRAGTGIEKCLEVKSDRGG